MSLQTTGLRKRYDDVVAVDGVDLTLRDGETLALLGPSGCGKSTLLRLIAGLEPADGGRVELDGRDLKGVPARARGIGMVFQDYALFPHLDVGNNVAFGLVELGWEPSRRAERVTELLEMTGLGGMERRRIDELSGGQRQRVALARALAPSPRVLLLDEPLSNLDLTLREHLKRDLKALLDRLEIRSIYVTHDQSEALTMGDRIGVMRRGALVQIGPSFDVLERPADAWVATFLGYRNVFDAETTARLRNETTARASLLRGDLLELVRDDGEGMPAAVVSTRRVGLAWELELRVAEWPVTIVWEGFARDLPEPANPGDIEPPRQGDRVRVRIPPPAWVTLGEAP